jgi:outer membrane protein OmpA-like peptidoglycan-associated protein
LEDIHVRSFIAPLILAPLVLATTPVFAQGNPSADQIINSLKPTGNLTAGGTRGIRLAAPSSEGTAPAQAGSQSVAVVPAATGQTHVASAKPVTHATAPAPAPAQTGGPSVNLTVNFPNGSADLTPEAMATLDALGKALASSDLANYRFRIEGHTDTVGSPDYNRALSERRAEAVVSYIESKYGVQSSRLQAVGMGEEGLLVSTPAQTPEPRNRRVQVVNLGA